MAYMLVLPVAFTHLHLFFLSCHSTLITQITRITLIKPNNPNNPNKLNYPNKPHKPYDCKAGPMSALALATHVALMRCPAQGRPRECRLRKSEAG